MPEMVPVDSSSIEAIGYDTRRHELHVSFVSSGAVYVYEGVEDWEFEALNEADSKGSYLNRVIKSHHRFRKL